MSPTKQLETTEQVVAAMGDLRRMRILEILTERQASVKELAALIQESPQTTHYHTKMLERAGLIEIVEKREVRGTLEKFYRAVADRFVAGEIVGKASSEFGLGLVQNFLELARYGAQSNEGEGVSLNVLSIRGNPERFKEFEARLQALVGEFQELNEETGQMFGLLAGVFPIPEEALPGLPVDPGRLLQIEGQELAL